jgi:hypothetical protein
MEKKSAALPHHFLFKGDIIILLILSGNAQLVFGQAHGMYFECVLRTL